MKVTVCELSDDEALFITDWKDLKIHLKQHKPDLLLLPEMPFCRWIATQEMVKEDIKLQAVQKHEKWLAEVEKLSVKYVVYSKPVITGNKFFNIAYVYQKGVGHSKIHTKSFFPEEPYFREETWFDAEEPKTFEVIEIGGVKMGALLCTEMWFTQHARAYGKQGVDILLCPRATGAGSVRQWIRCGQTLSVISGAYCLSSNRSGYDDNGFHWGGKGWVTAPGDGQLLGITAVAEKFFTVKIDLSKSREAKNDYPVYVKE